MGPSLESSESSVSEIPPLSHQGNSMDIASSGCGWETLQARFWFSAAQRKPPFENFAAFDTLGSKQPNAHAASASETAQRSRPSGIWSKPLIFSCLSQRTVFGISGADARAGSSEYGQGAHSPDAAKGTKGSNADIAVILVITSSSDESTLPREGRRADFRWGL